VSTGRIQHHLIRWNNKTAQLFQGAGASFLRAFSPESLVSILGTLVFAAVKLVLFLFIALTVDPPPTNPFVSTVFFIWNSTDVYTVRSANRHILVTYPTTFQDVSLQYNTNPEDDIGFGQLLPWFLLALPILQFWDIFREQKSRRSVFHIIISPIQWILDCLSHN
jgi:hypothetical protein